MKYSWIALVLLLCACTSGPNHQEQRAEQRLWEYQLLTHLNRFKSYPEEARLQGLTGLVRVAFVVDAKGNLIRHKIVSHTGSDVFVGAVEAFIPAASPVPAPPPSMLLKGEIEVVAPFVFCLEQTCSGMAPRSSSNNVIAR
ncbi:MULTISPECIES: TonB family protein [unclassified Pseudomonas]|uniref:TonB family protein n=1 Tax=unclassified Pseudomonas TaxID=196821 RepID=UPI001463AF15|nr:MULTISPECIES: TonB family protein [unclassified Pseudomonas]MBK5437880.1 TonB family protein [Pseudomonas sp. TH32]MDF3198329.1 TonB family protein [Pseudomonas sp. 1912-s]QJI38185.1 TonB family protein [Pseudomonas sp. ADAK13]